MRAKKPKKKTSEACVLYLETDILQSCIYISLYKLSWIEEICSLSLACDGSDLGFFPNTTLLSLCRLYLVHSLQAFTPYIAICAEAEQSKIVITVRLLDKMPQSQTEQADLAWMEELYFFSRLGKQMFGVLNSLSV